MMTNTTLSQRAQGEGLFRCPVCPHHCQLAEGQYGRCRARKREQGRIVSVNYGKITSLMLDPIEKKPLRRFYPGSMILSVGTFGCNLSCPFCQNHEISMAGQADVPWREITPVQLAALAEAYRSHGNMGIAFTYNEPLVGYEFVRDTARLVHERGMKNVMVTNGFAELLILEELLPYIDAMNIDLKGFTDAYYQKLGGNLETVKAFIARAARDCHVELTTLIVPGENDGEDEMEAEAKWVASLDAAIPLHVTRFFPQYRMTDRGPTKVETVYRLRDIAGTYLSHVYMGNC